MDRNSAGSHFGKWTTRRKTCSAGSQAMFSFFCHSARQSLVISLAGSGPGGTSLCSALNVTSPLPAAKCQSCRESRPILRTLQECQRVVFTSALNQSSHVLLGLRDPEHLFDGGQAGPDFVPAVVAEGAHALLYGPLRDGRSRRAVQNQRADSFIEQQEFVSAQPALVSELPAGIAPDPAPELRRGDFVLGKTDLNQVIPLHRLFGFAVRADRAYQPLRHHGLDRRGDQERLDAHVNQTRERARRIVRVQRAEHEVAGQRRANRDFRRLQIANFADHNDVGVLAQYVAQADGKRQADVRADRDLVDAFEFVFDRFLDRNDALVHRIDGAEAGVKSGGFAGASRAGPEHDAVRLQDDLAQGLLVLRGKTELVQCEKNLPARQQTQRNAFTVNGRHRRNADVDFLALNADVDASVLRQAFLGNVHP